MVSSEEKEIPVPRNSTVKDRPGVLTGQTFESKCGCGKMYITVNLDENDVIQEVFPRLGKAGGCAMAQSESIGRLASLASRKGAKPEEVAEQLRGIVCHRPPSCGEAIGLVIQEFIYEEEVDG